MTINRINLWCTRKLNQAAYYRRHKQYLQVLNLTLLVIAVSIPIVLLILARQAYIALCYQVDRYRFYRLDK
jgi:hypothetical protein